jgi:hypothetical protein
MCSSSQPTQATNHPIPSTRATDSPIENHTCTHIVCMLCLVQEGLPFLQENAA